jgi:O-antigen ligase
MSLSRRVVLAAVTLVTPLVFMLGFAVFVREFVRVGEEPGKLSAPALRLDTALVRVQYLTAGLRMIRDAPLLGHGPGGARRAYPRYRDADAPPGTPHLHNNVIQIAAERGLLGLAAWIWIWVAFFREAARAYAALPRAPDDDRAIVAGSLAAVTGFLVAGLAEYNFGDPHVVNLVWILMGVPFVLAASLAESVARREAAASGRRSSPAGMSENP